MPSVPISEAGGLLAAPIAIDNTALVVGTSSIGASAAIAGPYGDPTTLVAAYGEGPTVSDAGASIGLNTVPGLGMAGQQPSPGAYVYRTPGTVAGACGAPITAGITGTASANATVTGAAYNHYDVWVKAASAITVGTSGSFYWSVDAGRTVYGPVNLGTSLTYVLPGTNVTVTFGDAADTWVLNDVLTCPTSAPAPSTTDIDNFYLAYAASSIDVGILYFCGACPAATFAHHVSGLATLAAVGKKPYVIVNAREPNYATPESDATWMASVIADYASSFSDICTVVAAYGWFTDPVANRVYRRNAGASVLSRVVGCARGVSPNWVALGPLPNFQIVDGSANLIGHDENLTGGLDAAHFVTTYRIPNPRLRAGGPYMYRPWTLFPAGSKHTLIPFRRMSNAVEREVAAIDWQNIGNKVFYDPTSLAISTADQGALASTVSEVLRLRFKASEIQNLETDDPPPAPPLIQVSSTVVDNAGLVTVPTTVNPHYPGVIDSIPVTVNIQV
jgi:hypothetical protein